MLQHNGKPVKKDGYVSDIITDGALDFVSKNKDGPFFCYIAYNAPHTPLEVPAKYHDLYKGKIKLDAFPKIGFPIEGKVNLDDTAKIYGMITNIDDNIGRLLARLVELGIADETIVIFLTDNGPQQPRYNSGMRGRKGTVFEGGTHVPFFVRWPAGFKGDRDVHPIAAHIDVAPTLVEICGGKMPDDRKIDGVSLHSLWLGESIDWPDRPLFFQWHRGNVPQMYRAFAVRTRQWRLVQPDGVAEKSKFDKTKLMLFDIAKDPYEINDVADKNAEVVDRLKKQYETWFKDVESTRKFRPPTITVGSPQENPTILTRQDMRNGEHWLINVEKAGKYDIEVTLQKPASKDAMLDLRLGNNSHSRKIAANARTVLLTGIDIPETALVLEPTVTIGDTSVGVRFVKIERKQEKK
ncbi:MAG: sulfatase-like hydrolase/transferase [Planctomycetes bacterium]|nr:sulfatase-like hydrolase/transferase [Planctomycetota bacterium]